MRAGPVSCWCWRASNSLMNEVEIEVVHRVTDLYSWGNLLRIRRNCSNGTVIRARRRFLKEDLGMYRKRFVVRSRRICW